MAETKKETKKEEPLVAPDVIAPTDTVPLDNMGETRVDPAMFQQQQQQNQFPDRVAPVEETSGWKKALATVGYMVPYPLNAPFIAPYFLSEQKRGTQLEADNKRVEDFWKLAEEDPVNAGELLKNPIFSEPVMRATGATGTDIGNLSNTLLHKKLSTKEKITLINAGGMLQKNDDGSEEIIPRPYAGEMTLDKEEAIRKAQYDEFKIAWDANPSSANIPEAARPLQRMMDFQALNQKKTSPRLGFKIARGATSTIIVNQDTNEIIEVPHEVITDYGTTIATDEKGNPTGLLVVNKKGVLGGDPNDIGFGFVSIDTILEGQPQSVKEAVKGNPGLLMQIINAFRAEKLSGTEDMSNTPDTAVKSGNVKQPRSLAPKQIRPPAVGATSVMPTAPGAVTPAAGALSPAEEDEANKVIYGE